MKNPGNVIIISIISIVLTLSLLWCCITSFSIEVNAFVLIACTLIFTSVFSLISASIDEKKKFLASIAVIGIVFILTVLFSLYFILSSANYTINCVLKIYSQYMSMPQSISFADNVSNNADVFFVMISFILSYTFSVSLIRLKKIFPVVILSILLLTPCFILINTLPSLVALLPVVACLFALYLTTFIRKYNSAQNGNILLMTTSLILVVSIIICLIFPIENYERQSWQDYLLIIAQNITGNQTNNSSGSDSVYAEISQDIIDKYDLTDIGPTSNKHGTVMEVTAPETGNIYLKSAAYGNYSDNTWSILSIEQGQAYPENYNAFTMTKSSSATEKNMSISTEEKHMFALTPYYTQSLPAEFSNARDVIVKNENEITSYDIPYIPFSTDLKFAISYTSDFVRYREFVYDNYVDIPESTKRSLLKIAEENGISVSLSGIANGYDEAVEADLLNIKGVRDDLVMDIKRLVSNHGSYSLDTPKMPLARDFPVWFLNESDTGYCVHYATSAALMLRAHGIPARYVTGYYFQAEDGVTTTVLSQNAHAWVEYFDDEAGWIPLEATPASFRPASMKEEISRVDSTNPPNQEETTISPTELMTEPKTESVTDHILIPSPPKKTEKTNTLQVTIIITIVILSIIITLILYILIRRILTTSKRKKRFYNGKNKSKAIYIYRYIELLGRFSNNVIPNYVTDIAEKASFSRHTISNKEVSLLLSYALDAKKELLKNSSLIKTLYLKFIICI